MIIEPINSKSGKQPNNKTQIMKKQIKDKERKDQFKRVVEKYLEYKELANSKDYLIKMTG